MDVWKASKGSLAARPLRLVVKLKAGDLGVSKKAGTPKSSIKKYGFPLFSPSILGVFPLFLVPNPISKWMIWGGLPVYPIFLG